MSSRLAVNRQTAVAGLFLLFVLVSLSRASDSNHLVFNPQARVQRLLATATARQLVSPAKVKQLAERWAAVRLGDLPVDAPFEDELIGQATRAKLLDLRQAKALQDIAARQRLEDLGLSSTPHGQGEDPYGWLNSLMSWGVWIAGLSLAAGVLTRIGRMLVRAPRGVQALCSAGVTAAMIVAGEKLLSGGSEVVATALAIGSCVGSSASICLIQAALRLSWSPGPFTCLAICASWAAIYLHIPVASVAFLTAAGTAVTLGVQTADPAGILFGVLGDVRWNIKATLIGLVLIALGYGLTLSTASLVIPLVKAFWTVGLVSAFGGFGIDWWIPQLRIRGELGAVLSALAALGWGLTRPEGIFAGAGGLMILTVVVRRVHNFLHDRLSWPEYSVLFGLLVLGATRLAEHHWVDLIAILSATRLGAG
jgi:hypothetical protein